MPLRSISDYTKAGQFGYFVAATVVTLHYLQPINLLHSQQPYESLVTILVVTCVPNGRYETYSVRLKDSSTQQLIACRCDCY